MKEKSTAAHHLPDDWELPLSWKDWARQNTPLSAKEIDIQGEMFGYYWQSTSGSRALKRSWERAWKFWVKNIQFQRLAPRNPPQKAAQPSKSMRWHGLNEKNYRDT